MYVLINVNLRPDQVRQRYRSRFGVETSYRCMRATHAKTTSHNIALRFFLIALAFILVNVWVTLYVGVSARYLDVEGVRLKETL